VALLHRLAALFRSGRTAAPAPRPVLPERLEDAATDALAGEAERLLASGDAIAAVALLNGPLRPGAESHRRHRILGIAARAAGMHDIAAVELDRALDLEPEDAETLYHRGRLYLDHDDAEQAADMFQLALVHAPGHGPAAIQLARLHRKAGRLSDAAVTLEDAGVAREDADPDVCFEYGRILEASGTPGEAAAAYRRVLEVRPDDVAVLVQLGLLLLDQIGDATAAEDCFRRAVDADPASCEANANLALAWMAQRRLEDVVAHCDRMLERYPGFVEFRWNRGLARLLVGHYREGWLDYESRKLRPRGSRAFPYPEWDGGPLHGRTILVYAEQGLGDELMFASCLPDIVARAGHCVIECDVRLAPLYRRSFPSATVRGALRNGDRRWLSDVPAIDVQCAVGSLPLHLRPDSRAFAARDGYLVADPDRVAFWRSRLAAMGAKRAIGIAWTAGTLRSRMRLRSLSPSDLLPLLQAGDVTWIALQDSMAGFDAVDLDPARRPARILDSATAAIDDVAALICALDGVVTAAGTTAHLAGALGRPVYILVEAAGDWPWGSENDRTAWYPSARLFRQPRAGDWRSVIDAVGEHLGARSTC
jgi:tetratricopeptide (TPR) repeat protein